MDMLVTNPNMDKSFSRLYLYEGYLTRLHQNQSSFVESLNLMKNELSQLKPLNTLQHSWNEKVEINDKLLESIKNFNKLFTYREIGDYVLFSYDQSQWLDTLELYRGGSYPEVLGQIHDFYTTGINNPNVLKLNIFSGLTKVVDHLFSKYNKGNSHVGPYRIKKEDMVRFNDCVYNISQCANGRLDAIVEALQIAHLQKLSLGLTTSNEPGEDVVNEPGGDVVSGQ